MLLYDHTLTDFTDKLPHLSFRKHLLQVVINKTGYNANDSLGQDNIDVS